jgi:hypothetical protein
MEILDCLQQHLHPFPRPQNEEKNITIATPAAAATVSAK